ncbi:MAG: 6-phosphofructokinase, partial [Bacteroidota bacterium]|nr:6-phosphofructokinase [Bacteroidota bacterium]
MLTGNVLVAQGGGPTAVVNCSLVGVIEEAKRLRAKRVVKVIGALHSMDGIFSGNFIDLGKEQSSTLQRIYQTPGAALGSCRRKLQEEDYSRIIEIFKKYDIHYFFYIGGNGSMHTAHKLDQLSSDIGYDLTVIGIPKTIDNDLAFTDHSPGFGSAARYFASVTREIGLDVESLPPPISVIETLGRNTGWLTAAS